MTIYSNSLLDRTPIVRAIVFRHLSKQLDLELSNFWISKFKSAHHTLKETLKENLRKFAFVRESSKLRTFVWSPKCLFAANII